MKLSRLELTSLRESMLPASSLWTSVRLFLKDHSLLAKLVFLVAAILTTNPGAIDRMLLQLTIHRPGVFVIYALIWALSLLALIVIAMEPRWQIRLFWSAAVALSTSVAWGYQTVSSVELTVFDALSLWEARHEAGEAMGMFGTTFARGAMLFVLMVVGLMLPVRLQPMRFLPYLRIIPALPPAIIAGITYMKAGAGSFGMPKQFSQISIAVLAAYKTVMQPRPAHAAVAWQPDGTQPVKKLLLLVDESIRQDYLDTTGTSMPGLAAAMKNFTDFGPAASGGVCSNYSNTLLRFGAARSELGPGLGREPTIWQYAKRAGYRTVYIDAQASNITNLSHLQNFMTPAEAEQIDGFYAITDVGPQQADFELSRIVRDEMARGGPVFIYANKRGAHWQYDENYPVDQKHYGPTISEAGKHTLETRIASYRNALDWNVEKFFAAFWPGLDTRDSAIVYTSDHAQFLNPAGLTHCVSARPNQRMALVPLFAFSSVEGVKGQLAAGARLSRGKASHFMIAPSLLEWMGYKKADLATRYRESLTAGTPYKAAFTAGDLFGLFGNMPNWSSIDLSQDFKSTEATAAIEDAPPLAPEATAQAVIAQP